MGELGVIEGKTFLITGGATGLGAGIAESFLKGRAKAVAIVDIAEEAGKETAARLDNSYSGEVIYVKCDVSNENNLNEAFNEIVSKLQQVDVVINNAGIMNDSPNVWWRACTVNLQGLISHTLRALKHMRKDEGGHGGTIINISSVLGILKYPYLPIYSSCKTAVLHFSQCLSMDPFFHETGVRVLTMCYGATDTPLLHNLEKLCYDDKTGKRLAESTVQSFQKPESAINGLVKMFMEGANGSIWTANEDKPAQDITPTINKAFQSFSEAI